MSYRKLLNRTADVQRRMRTPDGQGGFTTGWQTVKADAPVRVRPVQPHEVRSAGQDQAEVTHIVYGVLSSQVHRGDRLLIAPFRDGLPDMELMVLFVGEPSKAHHLEIECRERRQAATAY